MALDVTKDVNYTKCSATEQGLLDTAIAAIKACYTRTLSETPVKGHVMNIYAVIKDQNESQEGT